MKVYFKKASISEKLCVILQNHRVSSGSSKIKNIQ